MTAPLSFYETFLHLSHQQRVYLLQTLTSLQFKWIKEAFVNLVNNKDIVCPLSEKNFFEKQSALIKKIMGKSCTSKKLVRENQKLVFKVIECIVNHFNTESNL